ncbi:RNA pseudouridine synthase 4, mitochondrial [Galdieria sulphuraria]|nr:RNA pseudouridine synthase 4, mitochondrial [Galdieria sulphuraria]
MLWLRWICYPSTKSSKLVTRRFSTFLYDNKTEKDELILTVTEGDHDTRLDRFLRRQLGGRLPQSFLEKCIRRGFIKIDGQTVTRAGERVRSSSILCVPKQLESFREADGDGTVERQRPVLSQLVKERVQNWVLYKDTNLMVINKPPLLACQGGSGLRDSHLGTLLPALSLDNEEPPKLVHRLDKEVSGTLLLARNSVAAKNLALLFQQRQVKKLYWALVIGNPLPTQGEIRKAVDGKTAITRYRVVEKLHSVAAWLELEPITGRKRQLRLHCAQVLNCPIFGDEKFPFDRLEENTHLVAYQGLSHLLRRPKGIHLHAYSISFPNIETLDKPQKTWKTVTAPLPLHMENTWNTLGFHK